MVHCLGEELRATALREATIRSSSLPPLPPPPLRARRQPRRPQLSFIDKLRYSRLTSRFRYDNEWLAVQLEGQSPAVQPPASRTRQHRRGVDHVASHFVTSRQVLLCFFASISLNDGKDENDNSKMVPRWYQGFGVTVWLFKR